MIRGLILTSDLAARATRAVVVVMAALCMTSLILQVFSRYILGSTFIWTEEAALFLFTWIVLLAGSLGVREGFHVRLSLLLNLLPPRARRLAEAAITILVGLFGGVLAWSGARYVDATMGHVSAAVRYPIEALHLAAPICGALIVVHAVAALAELGGGAATEENR